MQVYLKFNFKNSIAYLVQINMCTDFHLCELSFVDVVLDLFIFFYPRSCKAMQSVLTCLTYIVLTTIKYFEFHVWSEPFYFQPSIDWIHSLTHSFSTTHPDLIGGFCLFHKFSLGLNLVIPALCQYYSTFRI